MKPVQVKVFVLMPMLMGEYECETKRGEHMDEKRDKHGRSVFCGGGGGVEGAVRGVAGSHEE